MFLRFAVGWFVVSCGFSLVLNSVHKVKNLSCRSILSNLYFFRLNILLTRNIINKKIIHLRGNYNGVYKYKKVTAK